MAISTVTQQTVAAGAASQVFVFDLAAAGGALNPTYLRNVVAIVGAGAASGTVQIDWATDNSVPAATLWYQGRADILGGSGTPANAGAATVGTATSAAPQTPIANIGMAGFTVTPIANMPVRFMRITLNPNAALTAGTIVSMTELKGIFGR